MVGAITSTLSRPRMLVLGRFDGEGRLRYVGKTTQISTPASQQLVGQLTAASIGTHPWEYARFSTAWGNRDVLGTTLVAPDRVAEVSVDTAKDRSAWRHPVRLVRLRLDMSVADVPTA
ncbi:ATP dependent DNA ligase [Streptomyces anulatus]|uniref:ATP dependent DNA ligase n=1 Tax=Streptomyces anulatus TaxID=1892 RepID=UPI0036585B79